MNSITTIKRLADSYESADFLIGDPSWFMHQVEGERNQELTAFLASALSFGSRKQFMPKIQQLLSIALQQIGSSEGSEGYEGYEGYEGNDNECFYRMYTWRDMRLFLARLNELLQEYGSLKEFVSKGRKSIEALEALETITAWFSRPKEDSSARSPIPKDTTSSCKRLCMFLRWMVRDNSPVDLGIWSNIIDKRTLIIPLDTHVMQQANRLGLIDTRTASMSTARRLTGKLLTIFPDDPLKGDFALFGYGVTHTEKQLNTSLSEYHSSRYPSSTEPPLP